MIDKPAVNRAFAAGIALIACAALALQYALLVASTRDDLGIGLATLRFLSFFTILSNVFVALATMQVAIGGAGRFSRFFASASVRGATALCIGITCCIYFFVLAATWSPQGLEWLADVALHYIVPVLYLVWWLTCAPHRRLCWIDAMLWLWIPIVFLTWTLLRGSMVHEYPYPFVDVDALGVVTVARNCVAVGALFVLFGLVLVMLDRWLGPHRIDPGSVAEHADKTAHGH